MVSVLIILFSVFWGQINISHSRDALDNQVDTAVVSTHGQCAFATIVSHQQLLGSDVTKAGNTVPILFPRVSDSGVIPGAAVSNVIHRHVRQFAVRWPFTGQTQAKIFDTFSAVEAVIAPYVCIARSPQACTEEENLDKIRELWVSGRTTQVWDTGGITYTETTLWWEAARTTETGSLS